MEFSSRRSPVLARNGMVATSQPIAAMAGLRTLMEGGNAIDAAVTTAAALSVVEPNSTGIGGDMFALVWSAKEKKIHAINGSGRAPASASIEELKKQGLDEIPSTGPYAVSIPGTVDGWHTILERFGTISLSQALRPAITYAEEGFAATPVIAWQWDSAMPKLMQRPSGMELTLAGRAPRIGETVRLPELAGSLRSIAEGGRDAFYKGPIADKISAFVQEEGGWITTSDLAQHTSTWDEPIYTDYRDVRVWECPPNGQGLAALMALNIAEGFDINAMGFQTAQTYHHLIESMLLGFADARRYIADPRAVDVPIKELLSKDYANNRRALIQSDSIMNNVSFGNPYNGGDTVYLTCVDKEGNACSFINSVFASFGTGLVVPTTGIALQNRAALFSLDIDHPNALKPGKRPYQTIIPAMVTKDDEMLLSFGVMGGFQQPQGHLQVIANMIDFGLNPQEAVDALRFNLAIGTREVNLEEGLPLETVNDLERRGHLISMIEGYNRVSFGGGQIIHRDPDTGVLTGGSDPRKDGCAVGW